MLMVNNMIDIDFFNFGEKKNLICLELIFSMEIFRVL
jgi:hypothetical protein